MARPIKKKHYKHPIITMIKLDPEQALLVACITTVGGYFNAGGTQCMERTGGTFSRCARAVKGRQGIYGLGNASTPPS